MRHSRSEKALALTVLRRESRFRRRTALRGLLEAACREVRDLARFPQSSRAVTQKRIGASTGLRATAPSTQVPLGLAGRCDACHVRRILVDRRLTSKLKIRSVKPAWRTL